MLVFAFGSHNCQATNTSKGLTVPTQHETDVHLADRSDHRHRVHRELVHVGHPIYLHTMLGAREYPQSSVPHRTKHSDLPVQNIPNPAKPRDALRRLCGDPQW